MGGCEVGKTLIVSVSARPSTNQPRDKIMALCVARDLKNRILEALLAHQRKAQKEGRGVDLHLLAEDGQTVSLHQVMVMPRSPMLRNLAVSSGGAPLILLIPDTLSSTLQLLVSLLYGSAISVPVQSYLELCSLCTALDLQDWLEREGGEGSGGKSTGSCEVELEEASKEEAYVVNSDEPKCEVCGKKYRNVLRLQQHYNSAHFDEAPSPLITQRTRVARKLAQKALKATSRSVYAVLPRLLPIKRQLSKALESPIKVLQSESDVTVGRSQDKSPRSTFLPWKLQEAEEGNVAFRWQRNYLNRKLCQNRRVALKQKEFCCLWNNFLWIEVLPGVGKRHLPSILEAFFKERSRELQDRLLFFEAVLHVVTLEQTGLITQEAAENALQSLRSSLQTLQEHEEIHKQMIKNELDNRSDPLVRMDDRDDIAEKKNKRG